MSSLVGKVGGRAHTSEIGSVQRLSTATGINAFTTGNHVIHTGAPGLLTVVRFVVVRCTAADSITASLTAGAGVSATEIYPDQQLLGLTLAGKHWIFPVGGVANLVLAGQDLNLVISAAPTGVSQLIDVDVFGHEL